MTVPEGDGQIGMTMCPGRRDRLWFVALWQRDLEADFDRIADWAPDLMITLVDNHELARLGVRNFARIAAARVGNWRQLPIADGGVPGNEFERGWQSVGAEARAIVKHGGRVLLHCRGGLGRTGTIAARLLVELGAKPEAAMITVRTVRPKAIETSAQEQHLRAQAPIVVDPPVGMVGMYEDRV